MGQSTSELVQHQQIKDDETVEHLQILQKMVAAKIQAASEKMALQARRDSQLPILAIVDKMEKYMIKVENKPGDVEKAIDDLFDGKFLKALKDALVTAVNELLGNTVAGEQQVTDFHIAYDNNAFIRVDYFVYHYVFASKGLQDKFKNALGYTIQVGVLNIEKLNPQAALYEVSKCIGPQNLKDELLHLQDDVTFLEDLYKDTKRIEKIFAKTASESEVEESTERYSEPQ